MLVAKKQNNSKKTNITVIIFALIFLLLMLSGCGKDKDEPAADAANMSVLDNIPDTPSRDDSEIIDEELILKEEVNETGDKPSLENNTQQEQTEPFTEEQMRISWKNCANDITDKHLKSIMTYLKPELKENETIEILALNPEQFQYIQQNKSQITEYLSSQLKNNRIKLEINIVEDNTTQTPFTTQEKFAYMADKNTILKKFVQEFNLRLD